MTDKREAHDTGGDEDDLGAYIGYLQQQLLTPGWEELFDQPRMERWVQANRSRLTELAAALGARDAAALTRGYIGVVAADSSTDAPLAHPTNAAIFQPLLSEVHAAAAGLGLGVTREVHLATSTDVSASPASMPSGGEHIMFIGPGTSSFCNYWAKTYALTIHLLGSYSTRAVTSAADMHAALQADPSGLRLAVRLCLHNAFFGTTIGFGEVVQPTVQVAYRSELLRAMELFAVAHEYGHFLAEERLPMLRGQLDTERQHQLEYFCDDVGLALSRACSESSYLAFAGVGALVLLRSAEVTAAARAVVAGAGLLPATGAFSESSDRSHPHPSHRAARIRPWVVGRTEEIQRPGVAAFLKEFDLIATELNASVLQVFTGAFAPAAPGI